ncbi:hypothetical protein O181_079448 [Austropuccinia psidii MF-1]|uniref:Uncharacterized protein n=1 Tax=Austropuccinia psidii MF-1 TaxID=1389203 RepID=A0A9Q3FGQ0_9BASI|nr:hypothetical protein [Austropuccinia psidii MF-1]
MASGSHQMPPVTFIKGFPSGIRETPSFNSIGLIMHKPRVVHLWYYIPLCTIFPQKSYCDIFGTKLHPLNSSPQIHHPFQRKTSQPSSLAIHGGYQKTIQGLPPPAEPGGGFYFHYRISQGVIPRFSESFNQFSMHKVLQYLLGQPNWSIQAVFKQALWPWPFWASSYSTLVIHHTAQFSRWPDLH